MGDDLDYDDLDELLDEDPGKLEATVDVAKEAKSNDKSETVKEEGATGALNKEDPAVKEMIEDLQKEFANLMKSNDGENAEDKEAAENYRKLLEILEEAGQVPAETTTEQLENLNKTKENPGGFKDVISSTLDRLKENGNKVDSKLEEEKKQRTSGSGNPDEVLSQLLNELVNDSGSLPEEGEMDNAILSILNQMSSKEVLYQPMKEMQAEFSTWLEENKDVPQHKDKIDTYRQQYTLIGELITIYEKPEYNNDKDREEVTTLLDKLEQLGDSPVSKNFNQNGKGGEFDDLSKMLNIDGSDPNLANLDQDLADTCKQQ
ncbi:Pex19p [Nakaseomyces bracarensis]|uniref:Pex19p n=1 Tax=Nakaseomyces bracarensis TaxID=273131 RepID=UPI00387181F7